MRYYIDPTLDPDEHPGMASHSTSHPVVGGGRTPTSAGAAIPTPPTIWSGARTAIASVADARRTTPGLPESARSAESESPTTT